MNTLQIFGKRLKELRKAKKITQEQLAEIVELDPKQVCRIENGACFETLQKLANFYNVEIYDLFSYQHKQSKSALIHEMNSILINASDDQIELIYKIIKAVTL